MSLANFLSKAGNLAGLGSVDTPLANLTGMKWDASNARGRLGLAASLDVADYNAIADKGYYSSTLGAANAPDAISYLACACFGCGLDGDYITQIGYQFVAAATSADSVLVNKRDS